MQQGQELWNDTLYLISNEYLVAEQLYLVTLQIEITLDTWEIKDTGEVERIIHIQVNPEHRVVLHGVEGVVELLIVLILQRAGLLGPQRFCIVDDVIFLCFLLFAVFPLGLLTEGQWHRHELTVFVQQFTDLVFLQIFLAVIVDIQHDIRTAVGFLCFLDRKLR